MTRGRHRPDHNPAVQQLSGRDPACYLSPGVSAGAREVKLGSEQFRLRPIVRPTKRADPYAHNFPHRNSPSISGEAGTGGRQPTLAYSPADEPPCQFAAAVGQTERV
jgi:hypothetical protein